MNLRKLKKNGYKIKKNTDWYFCFKKSHYMQILKRNYKRNSKISDRIQELIKFFDTTKFN